jgi:transposase
MKITTIGIDLAKNVFVVHGVNEHGREGLKKVLKRDQVGFVRKGCCSRLGAAI